MISPVKIKNLGVKSYENVFEKMQTFTENRNKNTQDELWLVEHPPVFTQGRHGKKEHILNPHHIPIVQTDRGGQITYHGPGQAVIYFLIDLKRLKIGIKNLVCAIEKSTLEMMKQFNIDAKLKESAPGVYVEGKKIASLGLRVKQGKTYHGLSINVKMDLTPFSYINPCGYEGLKMCQISEYNAQVTLEKVHQIYQEIFIKKLSETLKQGASLCLS